MAALNVHPGVAADVIDDDPQDAKAALRTIREQSRVATAELKATVGVLRAVATDAPRAPAPGLAGLDALVRPVREAGVDVDVAVAGAVRPLPGAIDLTAYRILQESLTNVVRHAHATVARVLVCYERDGVVVQVEDDGAGPDRPEDGAGGYGLAGMHERAAAVGGALNAEPIPGGGFRVHARLPTT